MGRRENMSDIGRSAEPSLRAGRANWVRLEAVSQLTGIICLEQNVEHRKTH